MGVWDYLQKGGRHAELIWNRRAGKDDVCLHWAAVAAHKRVATYWHMLPQASQARKAIWEAVNPHTGKTRIDEAFPPVLRETTRHNEMLIKFKNGSTWQVVGSDNYNSLVGSPPAGVVYSEWALANPTARAYIRPIIRENQGWQLFITTPRGKNHAFTTYNASKNDSEAFAQLLTVGDTRVLAPEDLEKEKAAYIADYGEDQGTALFNQEWWCDFNAAILGAYYGREMANMEAEGRITAVGYDPRYPVYAAFDLGKTDDTSIWFFQVKPTGVYCIDFLTDRGIDVEDYVKALKEKPFPIEMLILPHDGKAERLGMKRTIEEQFRDAGFKVRVLANQSIRDGIQAARYTLRRCWMDGLKCREGIEALKMYRREWDDEKKIFKDNPLHDWSSHPADAFRYLSTAWREAYVDLDKPPGEIKGLENMTIDELYEMQEIQSASGRI